MLNLVALPARYIGQIGRERVAEICGVSTSTISMWVSRGNFPAKALEKLLEFDPTPIHEVRPLYTNPDRPIKLSLIVPSAAPINSLTRKCLDKLMDKDMAYEPESFNSLYHVRNMAMARWLRTDREWSFWSDADMLHPCGDARWFKEAAGRKNYPDVFAGMNTIYRLLAHKKKFVSVVYIEKTSKAPHVVFQGGDEPTVRSLLARGPQDSLRMAAWCGFGGVLLHRSVPEDIIKQGHAPQLKDPYMRQKLGYDFGFFNPDQEHFGDDISFCNRAARAGHQLWVDTAIFSEHIGARCFGYEDLRTQF